MVFKERFIISDITAPLLALGSVHRNGWSIIHDGDTPYVVKGLHSCGHTAVMPSILAVPRTWLLNTLTLHVPHAANLGNPVQISCFKHNANIKASRCQHGWLASTPDQPHQPSHQPPQTCCRCAAIGSS